LQSTVRGPWTEIDLQGGSTHQFLAPYSHAQFPEPVAFHMRRIVGWSLDIKKRQENVHACDFHSTSVCRFSLLSLHLESNLQSSAIPMAAVILTQ
jgi:hypothetical protein